MKVNEETVILGPRIVLVPYRQKHVPKYHEWMLSEELRALTASEPLSLDEEYEMQEKWQVDEDKLTFIILSLEGEDMDSLVREQESLAPTDERLAGLPMIGDVNIFLYGALDDLRKTKKTVDSSKSMIHGQTENDEDDESYAEVEIMIAEQSYRRKGLAIEALQLILGYATGKPQAFRVVRSTLSNGLELSALSHQHTFDDAPLKIMPERLVTRISETNVASIQLFEKLGFEITKRVEVFQEVEMRYRGLAH